MVPVLAEVSPLLSTERRCLLEALRGPARGAGVGAVVSPRRAVPPARCSLTVRMSFQLVCFSSRGYFQPLSLTR